MKGSNNGCHPSQARKIIKETVHADGHCLFNCATLALEGVVNKPMEVRETIASIMMSDP
jgi:hypothetical protein